jgi:hypothetical protein
MNPRVHREAEPPTATFFLHPTEKATFAETAHRSKVNDRNRAPPQAVDEATRER